MTGPAAAARLIVALDMPGAEQARRLVDDIGETVGFYKIGLELLFGGGLDIARDLKAQGKSVFLDLKFLDIANTVEKAVANATRLGVDFLTVHGVDRKTMDAAVRGRGSSDLKLLAVTVMTSLGKADLIEQGITDMTPRALVQRRAEMAIDAGFDGVVSSGHEAAAVRAASGNDFLIVTPGIRPSGGDEGDQVRVMTPGQAIAAGASHLVVGRPITRAEDPGAVAERMVADIAKAF